ncbi:MAG: hypothetical protein IMW89_12780 [Ktedonobacteraceae bacterium]|nr:hypothetical protein [Ktedonobacteraceae bacterium]
MKRSLLSRLQTNGACYIAGSLILLLVIPLYQAFTLTPQGYGNALHQEGLGNFLAYLSWVNAHSILFLIYRLLLIIAFALLVTLPFTLFRIIVAQEILGQREYEERESDEDEHDSETRENEGMPAYAWRGKGFAVIAAWAGIAGIALYLAGTIASTIYVISVSQSVTVSPVLPTSYAAFSNFFSLLAQTAGTGLLALSTLFFGAMIARSGRNLWPGMWVAFGYLALAVAALLSGSAVGVASAPAEGQAPLTSPAVLLFALWVLWLGVMLVRLRAE